jgi:methyl-galactoside transport system substrate-binding protein
LLKKVLVLAMVLVVLVVGVAVNAAKPVNIGCVIYKFDDTFMTGVRNNIDAAAKTVGAKVDIVDAQNMQATCNDKVDLFITKKVNALAVNPVDLSACGVIIDKAKKANIPLVLFNRQPFKDDMAKWNKVYYVGAIAAQSGIMQGQMVVDYFKKHPTSDGVINYVMITGEPGHQDAILRTKWSIDTIVKAGYKVNKVAEDTGMWDRVKGQEKMQAFLATGKRIDVVLANNDDMALGAIEALKAAGYFKGDKYMPVVGVDATAPGQQALEDGTMLGTVLNDAKNQGVATLKLSYVLATGKKPTKANIGYNFSDENGKADPNGKYIWVPYKPITKANIKDAR